MVTDPYKQYWDPTDKRPTNGYGFIERFGDSTRSVLPFIVSHDRALTKSQVLFPHVRDHGS